MLWLWVFWACAPAKMDGEPFMVLLLDAVRNVLLPFPDRSASSFFFFLFFFPLRLNVLTIFQVFKNRVYCVAMAPCATPEQLSHPFDAV